ncbi:TetR/AcrR family transcriptional regulator [Pedobacter caeni]|uniref:Transcriptional regulator, TetR family n=1 Tax=Pedobacter caeni TaxID=288992 RepID=A0A1M5GN84_9SPHI|nr:TetR/AcrR family transcriptional regulator [Pedobacter caeni]SHG05011.1 transcriptional regulator, TetR family [Pedobacter caeni]
MGISERKLKYKESFKREILDAAKKLFLKDGFEATSIRKMASEIRCSPATIYLYYKDKSDIFYDLHKEGFKILIGQLEILKVIENPFDRLKTMGLVYLKFSQENSDFYELMYAKKTPEKHWDEGNKVYTMLKDIILQCQKGGLLKDTDTDKVVMMIWSLLHGACMLSLQKQLECITSDKEMATDNTTIQSEDIFNAYLSLITLKK